MSEKRLNLKGILITALIITLIIVLAITTYVIIRNRSNKETIIDGQTGIFYNVGEFMTNLSNENAKRYIRVTIETEITHKNDMKVLDSRISEIRNNIILLLNSYSAEQLNTSSGKQDLIIQVRSSINSILQEEVVLQVYFTGFIIQ